MLKAILKHDVMNVVTEVFVNDCGRTEREL
jgi:hypothetical protein